MYNFSEEDLLEADAKLLDSNQTLKQCTQEERFRFIEGLGLADLSRVEKDLLSYIDFRETDLKIHKEHLASLHEDGSLFDQSFYRVISITNEKSTIDGSRIAYILPAAFNLSDDNVPLYRRIITPARYHALTIALYLDSMLARDSRERLTIVLDARSGEGENFGNTSVYGLMPICRAAVKILQSMFQERLRRCILFPLPRTFMYCWELIKLFIDKESLSRYILIGATKENSQVDSGLPRQLEEIMDVEAMKRLEKRRRDMF